MNIIRIAAASLNQIPLDWEGNVKRIKNVIDEAIKEEVALLCLPELCITGYGCEDTFLSSDVTEKALRHALEIKNYIEEKHIVVSLGLPVFHRGALYNCAYVISGYDQGSSYFVPKQHLAADGIHYEPRWFKEWKSGAVSLESISGNYIGDSILSFRLKDDNSQKLYLGFEICEDAWVADRPGSELAKKGVDIIFNPSASHFAFGKSETREAFIKEGSRAYNCVYVYSNLLGNESGRAIYDGDTYIAVCGEIIASGERFSLNDHVLTIADIDFDKVKNKKAMSGSFRFSFDETVPVNDVYHYIYNLDNLKDYRPPKLNKQKLNKFEEFESAAALGLFDYMRKSHSKGFALSLSGGADSSAVACLIRKTIEKGVFELGAKEFIKRSGFEFEINNSENHVDEIMNQWLTCVYQSTKNSSEATETSAKSLAESLNAKYYSISINDIVNKYISEIEGIIGRPLTWEQDDVTLQNIQARVRSPSIWMIANINNSLLLSTSNRSEAAVGYATMDGDTSGGLAPIAGIDKTFLLQWLKHLKNDKFYANALKEYYKLVPTAELRPKENNQTDETDLMPYDVLNKIEKFAIRDKLGVMDVYKSLLIEGYSQINSISWTTKFFKLWCRNQWKRERYAVSFHYDDENLDPKSWCRFPILSSGYEEELNELSNILIKDIL